MGVRSSVTVALIASATVLAMAGCGAASPAPASTTTATPTSASPSATLTRSDPPTPTSSTPAPVTSSAVAEEPPAEQTLTVRNNKDLAVLLKVGDPCDEKVATFATSYAGRTIEFDGSVAAMANHEDYTTRFDILLAPGSKGANSSVGPAFQFQDVNIFDLNLTGADTVGVGDKLHIVATVGEVDPDQCLFLLVPVSTTVR